MDTLCKGWGEAGTGDGGVGRWEPPLPLQPASSLPPLTYCCPNPTTEQTMATYVMWKRGREMEGEREETEGEERTDSCGLLREDGGKRAKTGFII